VLLAPLAVLGRTFAPRARHLLLVHGIEVWGDAAFRRVPRWERRLVARVFDRIVTVSRLTGVRMRAAYGISEAVFRRLAPAVEDEGPGGTGGAGGATVLTVARLGPDMEAKGVKTLVEAMPALVRLVPEARLRIVGDGPRRAELAELARQLGVGDRVELAGRVSDEELERAYASAAVFALPSRQEGFGIVYLEAWRHSLPVVAGDADAGAEVVEPGVTGLLVPPGDARALAEALADLLRDPERRRRMGEAGRAAVAQRWTHRRFRDQLEAVLRDETETAA
jgi:phosphatidylinositol alpha-1,6-mannosyltransferase